MWLLPILIVSIILVIIILVVVFYDTSHSGFAKYMFNKSEYAPTNSGFSGVPTSKLAQPSDFYEKHHGSRLTYLIAVYPLGASSLRSLTSIQLASFYNSLTFYYNCQFKYTNAGFIPGVAGNEWSELPCAKDYPLPYPPQGYFYNFYTYQNYNIPLSYSNSSGSEKEHLLSNFGASRPGIAFTNYSWKIRPGPGQFWVPQRTIQRHIWYPNGPINLKKNPTDQDIWELNAGKPINWNYPMNWINGMKDNHYIEVTHYAHSAGGVTTSPGWWYNAFAGTGLFLNLGKTFVATSKMGAAFSLAKILAQTDPATFEKFFQVSDPYTMIYNLETYTGCESVPSHCASVVPCCMGGGMDGGKGILGTMGYVENTFLENIVRYQNEHGIPDNTPTPEGIKIAIDAAVGMTDYALSRFAVNFLCDEPAFFIGTLLGYDTIQMPYSANSSGYFVYEIIDLRMPPKYRAALKNRDYSQIVDIKYTGPNNIKQFLNTWNKQYVTDSIEYIEAQKLVTIRDPLDIFNDSKSKGLTGLNNNDDLCPNNADQPHKWYSLYSPENKLSDAYKCLLMGTDAMTVSTCRFTGKNPTC